jgi:hypothetical protein
MNNITTSGIVDPSKQQPFLGGSLAFLQTASAEMVSAICNSLMGDTKFGLSGIQGVAIAGGGFNGTLDTMFLSYIYFNGELFYCPGKAGLNAFVNVPVFILDDTSVSPDPITYSDGTSGNVHRQRRLQIVDQVSGSGLFDVKDLLYVNSNNGTNIASLTIATSSGSETDITSATYTTPKGLLGMTRNFKITLFGDNVQQAGTTATTGATYKIKVNGVTVATNNVATSGDGVSAPRITVCCFYRGTIAAGTIVKATITRNTSNDQTFANGTFLVEEVN